VPDLPEKLKHDAILEALLEVRFESPLLVELLFGRLAGNPIWRAFRSARLPTAEMPAIFRRINPDLRFAPIYELKDESGSRSIKLGPNVISFHNMTPYLGWSLFSPALTELLDFLFHDHDELQIMRLGLRYINAFTKHDHGISNISDLAVSIDVAEQRLQEQFQLHYFFSAQKDIECSVRVGAPAFVQGVLPPSTSAVADIDIYSSDRLRVKDAAAAKDWVARAHAVEKEAFFKLLTPETIADLREDG
jgi:uncharacterized protein (TIGR04255 family)